MNSLILISPIIISLLSFFQTIKKDNSSLVSELSKELHYEKPNPYVVEFLISKIHIIRPISYEHIMLLLKSNNAYYSLLVISKCRRLLCLAQPMEINGKINFEFTPFFKKKLFRILSMIICVLVVISMYYEFTKMFYSFLDSLLKLKYLSPTNSEGESILQFKIFTYASGVLASLIVYSIFSKLFINIFQAKRMLALANNALNQ